MLNRFNFKKQFLIIAFFWIILPFTLPAQNYKISEIHPYLSNDSLNVKISFRRLFDDKVRKALLAGLPMVLEISTDLLDSQRQIVHSKNVNGKINYDVWEEYFSLDGLSKDRRRIQTLSGMKSLFENFPITGLASAKTLDVNTIYLLNVKTRLIVLTRKQSRQLWARIQNSEQTEEELPSQERSTGFKLNLNRVVQLFVSGGKNQEEYSADALSKNFRLSELGNK